MPNASSAASLSWLLTFQVFQPFVMQFGDSRERPDVFRVRGNGFPDGFHLGIVPLESLIVILLAGGELIVTLGYLFLKMPQTQGKFLNDSLNTV